ncbi:hypothetical protein T02_2342 [Trichinella nativa]|uniref:Uncharacterized protein n=1 Tax=Trichinella nativa TaxID=6335 RepID=A0A0V1LQ76_9BILA|nr:hypothetical protein T02_2342 [Trichinella nativa]
MVRPTPPEVQLIIGCGMLLRSRFCPSRVQQDQLYSWFGQKAPQEKKLQCTLREDHQQVPCGSKS